MKCILEHSFEQLMKVKGVKYIEHSN
jgi:hypothetical protein